MRFIAQNVKISGPSDDSCWGTAFSENGLFILLETQGKDGESAGNIGKTILDLLLTKITNYKERNLKTLSEIITFIKETYSVQTLTVGFLEEDILYLGNLGEGEVLMCRSGKIGKILQKGEISSGKVQENDVILFGSKTFLSCVGEEDKNKYLKSNNIEAIGEEACVQLSQISNSNGATAVLFVIKAQIEKEEQTEDMKIPKKDYKADINQRWQSFKSFIQTKKGQLRADEDESKPKKTLLTVAVILILLLIASIFLNINNSQTTSKQYRFKQTLELVSHQYNEAVSLIDLNPSRARVLLSDGKIGLSQLLKDFPKNSREFTEINEWLNKIAEKEVSAYKIFKFTAVPLFFDLNLLKNGGVGNKIVLYKKLSVILDNKNKALYSLALDSKKAGIIAGSEIVKDAQIVAVHGKFAYLLNSEGISEIDISTKAVQTVIAPDSQWGEITQLVAFGGNLYLLDKKNNTVWKYIKTENGFSKRTSYLNPDVQVSFSGSGKMVIDGSVWVLGDPSTIIKFTSGRGGNFGFKGLSDTISDISAIFTSDEAKNFYVLDKRSQRILVFDKDGNYGSQYQWDELGSVDDLVVLEEEKKIFVLSGSKIYAIDIKE